MAIVGGGDGAHHVEVADDGRTIRRHTLHVAERGAVVVGCCGAEGQRLAPAVEGAGELMAAAARHAADGDVCAQLHGLACEVALVVFSQQVAEDVPAPGGVDGVGVARLREVRGVGSPLGLERLVAGRTCRNVGHGTARERGVAVPSGEGVTVTGGGSE